MSLPTLMRLTLLELWRQRLSFVPIALFAGILLIGSLFSGELNINGRPLAVSARDVAGLTLPALRFCAGLVAAIAGAGALAGEVERGTVLLLATKPVPRWCLVLGKALGVFAFLAASFAVWGLTIALLYGARVSMAGAGPIFAAAMLSLAQPALIAALAICFSARLPVIGAIGASLFAWLIAGAAVPAVRIKEIQGYEWIGRFAEGVTTLVPLNPLEGLPDAVVFGAGAGAGQWLALLAIPGWLLLAMALFQRRNLS